MTEIRKYKPPGHGREGERSGEPGSNASIAMALMVTLAAMPPLPWHRW